MKPWIWDAYALTFCCDCGEFSFPEGSDILPQVRITDTKLVWCPLLMSAESPGKGQDQGGVWILWGGTVS